MSVKLTKKAEAAVLASVLLLGVLLRVFYLVETSARPEFDHPGIDAAYHDFWARGLARGEWRRIPDLNPREITHRPFFRPPGYPYFLALVYLLPGRGYLAARLAQFSIGIISAFLVFSASRRWSGAGGAILAAAFFCFYWIFIYFEGELLDTSLATFGILLFANLLLNWEKRISVFSAFAAGASLGGLVLVRANALLLAPAAMLWMAWAGRRAGITARALRQAGVLAASAAVLILPATVRNYLVSGELVLVSANSGMSLLVGNNDLADGTNHYLPGFGTFGSPFQYPRAVRAVEREKGRPVGYSEADRYFGRRARRWIAENPGRFLALTLRKAALFWGPAEVTNNREIYFARRESAVLSFLPGGFPFLLALFLAALTDAALKRTRFLGAGAPAGSPVRTAPVLFILLIGFYFLSMLPFAAAARYRVPVIPFMIIIAASGIAGAARAVFPGPGRERRGIPRASVFLAAAVLFYIPASREFAGYQPSPAKWHFDRAAALDRAGRPAEAEEEYRRSLSENPGYEPAILNLAAVLLNRGQTGEAIRYYRLYLKIKPGRPRAYSNLAGALVREGRYEEALELYRRAAQIDPDDYFVLGGIGRLYYGRGEMEKALAAFERRAKVEPYSSSTHNSLGLIYWETGRVEAAAGHFRRAVELEPTAVEYLVNLANTLAALGRTESAEDFYRRAVESDPSNASTHYNYAVAMEKAGRVSAAADGYRRALRADPRHIASRYNLALLLIASGEREEARRQLEAVERLAPGDERVKRLKDRLGP